MVSGSRSLLTSGRKAQEQITAVQKGEFNYRRVCNTGAAEGTREGYSEEGLKSKLDHHRQKIGKSILESGNSMFKVWKRGHWLKKWSEGVAVAAWEQGFLL